MIILVVLVGLLIGSFLNVCIFRIPRNEEIVVTPSHCMQCGYGLKWYDLIPIFSYIGLRGRCRKCQQPVSIQYPLVEALNGLLYAGLYLYFGLGITFVLMAGMTSALLVIAWIDFEHYIIPDGLVIFIGILGLIRLFMNLPLWYNYIVGFFVVSGILFLAAVITKGGMGGGDIKLMAVAGLFTGWQAILLALMIAAILGSLIGIGLMVTKKIERKAMIPFGPFLTVGIFIAMTVGEQVIDWYLKLLI